MPATGAKAVKHEVKRSPDVRFQQRRSRKAESREEDDIRFTSEIPSGFMVAFHCGEVKREFHLKAISDHTHDE